MVFFDHFPNYDFTKAVQEAHMNKTIRIYIWHVFLASTVFVLVSCSVTVPPTVLPVSQSPTPVPLYIHYTPSKGSNIHLEFDYPSSWVFSEEMQEGGLLIAVGLGDPRFHSLPTPPPDGINRVPNDFGSITIWITPRQPGQNPDTELESHKQGYKDEQRITSLKDYKTTIDGHDASVLEYQINDPESYTSLMFARRIFFVVKDQMYEIYFTIAEKDRGDEFEQGYEYFFNSLDIVP